MSEEAANQESNLIKCLCCVHILFLGLNYKQPSGKKKCPSSELETTIAPIM